MNRQLLRVFAGLQEYVQAQALTEQSIWQRRDGGAIQTFKWQIASGIL